MRLLIKEWRHARRLTQRQLARYLSISPATLSRYETDSGSLTAWRLLELATVLQITPGMLFPGARDEFVRKLMEHHVPDSNMREVVGEYLAELEVGNPDTPPEQQSMYRIATTMRAWSDTLWYLIVSRQAAAAQESQRLQQALEAPPAAPLADITETHEGEPS